MAELERELGIKLLARGRLGARPTQSAHGITEHARKMLQSEAAIAQEVALQKGLVTGRLRVVVFRSVAHHLMPPLIKRLSEKYPGLEVTMLEPVVPEHQLCADVYLGMLRRAEVDVTFLHLPKAMMPMEGVLSWQIMLDPYVAVVPPTFSKKSLSDQDFLDQHLIVNPELTCGKRIQSYLKEHLPGVAPKHFIDNEASMLNMTAQGLGISVLPRLAITHLPAGLRVMDLPSRFERPISVGVQATHFKTPAVRAFLSSLKELYPESELPLLPLAARIDPPGDEQQGASE